MDGVRRFRGHQDDGHFYDDLEQEWLDECFKTKFPSYYNDIMNDDNIGKTLLIPFGTINAY